MRKRVLSLCMVLALCLSLLPSSALAELAQETGATTSKHTDVVCYEMKTEKITGGPGGGRTIRYDLDVEPMEDGSIKVRGFGYLDDNVTWTLDENGTMTVEGTGEAKDGFSITPVYYSDENPDRFYNGENYGPVFIKDLITELIFKEGITGVEEFMFFKCSALKRISFPSSMKYIAQSAFSGCDNLTDIYYAGSKYSWYAIDFDNFEFALGATNPLILRRPDQNKVEMHYDADTTDVPPVAYQSSAFQKVNQYAPGLFSDVSSDTWCAEYVKTVYEYGIMGGKSDGCFDTTGSLTVAQAIVMAARLHNNYNKIGAVFQSSQPWYQSYLDYAIAYNLLDTTHSDYNVPISRAEYASILSRVLPDSALPEINTVEDGAIPDVSVSSRYYNAVYHLYRAGILTGNDARGTFSPDSNITRGAASAIISRLTNPSLRQSVSIHKIMFEPVPLDKLTDLASFRKNCTDAELQKAYDIAIQLVEPYANLSREEQVKGIAQSMRRVCDYEITYSSSVPHYNDPYGYFVLGVSSCAGCVRATRMCLNILGISTEHINENQWSHQWCRANINGAYWICDAFGAKCCPEPNPYGYPGDSSSEIVWGA